MTYENYIVTGLGFGDEGKGSVVDLLCRHKGADLVVRHNGGGQAAHNVITPDGRHHTFAQLGSGSFVPGVRTLLSRYMMVNPMSFVQELSVFEVKGTDMTNRVYVDERAPVTTPFHVFLNRAREAARGVAKHGTTGMGISETVLDHAARPGDAMTCKDIEEGPVRIMHRLKETRDALMPEMERLGAKAEFERISVATIMEYFRAFRNSVSIVTRGTIRKTLRENAKPVVFEGAQGVLLDEDFGFHPHTTWSTTTSANAHNIIHENAMYRTVTRIGVTRSYLTRHGAGPFPTEDYAMCYPELHNGDDGLPGQFRQGWLDMELLAYALRCTCGVDGIVVNHADYPVDRLWEGDTGMSQIITPENTRQQEALCRRAWRPVNAEEYSKVPNDTVLEEYIAESMGTKLLAVGNGPTATDKEIKEL